MNVAGGWGGKLGKEERCDLILAPTLTLGCLSVKMQAVGETDQKEAGRQKHFPLSTLLIRAGLGCLGDDQRLDTLEAEERGGPRRLRMKNQEIY